jgi:hypothetical protein
VRWYSRAWRDNFARRHRQHHRLGAIARCPWHPLPEKDIIYSHGQFYLRLECQLGYRCLSRMDLRENWLDLS